MFPTCLSCLRIHSCTYELYSVCANSDTFSSQNSVNNQRYSTSFQQEEKARKEEEEAKKRADDDARKKMILSNLTFTGYRVTI